MKICENCKAENLDKAKFCRRCGNGLAEIFEPDHATPGRPVTRRNIPPSDAPENQGRETYDTEDATGSTLEGIQIGGALLLIVSVFGMLLGTIVPDVGSAGLSNTIGQSNYTIVLSAFGIFAGVLALLRRGFIVSLFLAVLTCFAVGPFFITSIGAIISAIVIAKGRKEFIPIYVITPDNNVPCPACGHKLFYANVTHEWYCFNCNEYKKLPRRISRPSPDTWRT